MKTDITGTGTPLNKKDLTELLKETKETIAVEIKSEDSISSFSVIDLWNVQKKHRPTTSMMRRRLN